MVSIPKQRGLHLLVPQIPDQPMLQFLCKWCGVCVEQVHILPYASGHLWIPSNTYRSVNGTASTHRPLSGHAQFGCPFNRSIRLGYLRFHTQNFSPWPTAQLQLRPHSPAHFCSCSEALCCCKHWFTVSAGRGSGPSTVTYSALS